MLKVNTLENLQGIKKSKDSHFLPEKSFMSGQLSLPAPLRNIFVTLVGTSRYRLTMFKQGVARG
jgi:hypothetical protein